MHSSSGQALMHLVLCLLISGVAHTQAQAQAAEPGIYTCTDAQGRKLTSDRPIAECNDREQKLLNPSGTVRSKLGPTLTALERNELELKEKALREELARNNEEKRRDQALLIRYPNQGVHDKERVAALNQVGVVRQAAANRVKELLRQRLEINFEMEFYKKDPTKVPASLRRRLDEDAVSLDIQNRFIADQDAELRRVNGRFDEELGRLKQLWATYPASPGSGNKTR